MTYPHARSTQTQHHDRNSESHKPSLISRFGCFLFLLAVALGLGVPAAHSQSDTQPPTITQLSPAAGAIGQSVGVSVSATFSEAVQPSSLSFVLRDSSNTVVPSTVTYVSSTNTAALSTNTGLAPARTYTATLSGATDLAGNAMSGNTVWSFSTGTPGFQESIVLKGLQNPTAFQFASDGRVFVAQKSGVILVYQSLTDTAPIVFADLRTNVDNYGNRGLLALTLDPNFPSAPYVYVFYTYDAPIDGIAPTWGAPGVSADPCPQPNGSCLVSGRISRLQVNGNVSTNEQVLVNDWYQQYPSQSVGNLAFGPDGSLYASAGDGASSTFVDYGQTDTASPEPANQGGALRSQDLFLPAEPVTLDGSVIRVHPDTGLPVRQTTTMTVSQPTVDSNGV